MVKILLEPDEHASDLLRAAQVLDRVRPDVKAVLQSAEVQAKFTQDDIVGAGDTPQQFGELIRTDMERWRTVVKQANIKID